MLIHHHHGAGLFLIIGSIIAIGLIGMILVLRDLLRQLIKMNLELEDE